MQCNMHFMLLQSTEVTAGHCGNVYKIITPYWLCLLGVTDQTDFSLLGYKVHVIKGLIIPLQNTNSLYTNSLYIFYRNVS